CPGPLPGRRRSRRSYSRSIGTSRRRKGNEGRGMYRKDVNERSPMRVFEKSMHGGLGRGNVGGVASGAGVGKTALLVQIALDDLLRERKVLHISHEHAVDHVRAYYDEIFRDLAAASKLDDPAGVRLEVERNRLLYSHVTQAANGPPSDRG